MDACDQPVNHQRPHQVHRIALDPAPRIGPCPGPGPVDHRHGNQGPGTDAAKQDDRGQIAVHQQVRAGPDHGPPQHRVTHPCIKRALGAADPIQENRDQHRQIVQMSHAGQRRVKRNHIRAAISDDHQNHRHTKHDRDQPLALVAHAGAGIGGKPFEQMRSPPQHNADDQKKHGGLPLLRRSCGNRAGPGNQRPRRDDMQIFLDLSIHNGNRLPGGAGQRRPWQRQAGPGGPGSCHRTPCRCPVRCGAQTGPVSRVPPAAHPTAVSATPATAPRPQAGRTASPAAAEPARPPERPR